MSAAQWNKLIPIDPPSYNPSSELPLRSSLHPTRVRPQVGVHVPVHNRLAKQRPWRTFSSSLAAPAQILGKRPEMREKRERWVLRGHCRGKSWHLLDCLISTDWISDSPLNNKKKIKRKNAHSTPLWDLLSFYHSSSQALPLSPYFSPLFLDSRNVSGWMPGGRTMSRQWYRQKGGRRGQKDDGGSGQIWGEIWMSLMDELWMGALWMME